VNIPYAGFLSALIILLPSIKSRIKLPRLPFTCVINYTSKHFAQLFLMLKTRMSFSILASNKIIILISIFICNTFIPLLPRYPKNAHTQHYYYIAFRDMVTQSKTISYLSYFSAHAGSDSNHVVTFWSCIPRTQFNFIITKSLRISFPSHLNTVFLTNNKKNNNHNRQFTTHSKRIHHHTTAVTTATSNRKTVTDRNTNLSSRRPRMIYITDYIYMMIYIMDIYDLWIQRCTD
jgi:hypothetical protein